MPKYYCDYCDVFLTHDSSSVRKAHNAGRNHLTNVKDYYASLGHDKAQDLIDEITKQYERGDMRGMRPPMGMGNPMMGGPPFGGFGGPPPGDFGMPPPQFSQPPPQFQPPTGFPSDPNASLGRPPIDSPANGSAPQMPFINPERARALGI